MHRHRSIVSAERVEEGPYNLKTLETPVLHGIPLRLFASVLESPLGILIQKPLKRKSGLPQVLSEIKVPEKPTFTPTSFFEPEKKIDEVEILSSSGFESVKEVYKVIPETTRPPNRPSRIRDYHQTYLSGRKSPLDVAEKILSTLDQFPNLHWFVASNKEEILSQAEASTKRYESKTPLSILDGVPFSIKDSFHAFNYMTTCGTAHLKLNRYNNEIEAPIVSVLKSLGAILLGKTNMHEIGLGVTGLNLVHGTPVNPWDNEACTGGSTSGGGAIVASGLCPFTIGTDGGGSVRIPSSFCGIFGMKMTHGREISQCTASMDYTVCCAGPMTNHVEDAMVLYSLLAQRPPTGAGLYLPKILQKTPRPLEGMKIGIYWEWFHDVEQEIKERCREGVDWLVELGMELVTIVIPELEYLRVAHTITIASEMSQAMHLTYKDGQTRRKMNPDVRINLTIASHFKAQEYIQAQCIRTRMGIHFKKTLRKVDCIATPTTPMTAPKFHPKARKQGESNVSLTSKIMKFMPAANFLGLPATSLPIGLDSQRKPIGLQFIGKHWDEALLFKVCYHLEQKLIAEARTTHFPKYTFDPLT